ncbi:MAG: ribosomal protein S18-alanine N-acetyltransferase [Nitrospirae bacterium]|jgi:[ribosomal protein S18]-alanine N-acetyltransferase|nr:ribosomal protein S18-alanine N-acetyltransferase [Nitrospirota bacterium]
MADIIIREMHEDDIPEILRIERMSFPTPWTEAAFINEIYKPYALTRVVLQKNNVIGYICVNRVLNEGHILNLAVHPEFRRQGIASMLMQELLKELKNKGCRFIYLEVRVSSLGARKFYERFGFKVVGARRDYYQSPVEDAALMMLGL